jgi:hypothetical protein
LRVHNCDKTCVNTHSCNTAQKHIGLKVQ